MNEIIHMGATITANGNEELIGTLSCAQGEKITILETGYSIAAAGFIRGFVRNELVEEVHNDLPPDENNRVVRNNVLLPGDEYRFVGSDTSGAPNAMGVLIVIDRQAG